MESRKDPIFLASVLSDVHSIASVINWCDQWGSPSKNSLKLLKSQKEMKSKESNSQTGELMKFFLQIKRSNKISKSETSVF